MQSNWMNMPVTTRLGVGHMPDGGGDTGAALTPAEARQLAAALLRQAAAADHPDGDAGTGRVVANYVGGETYAVTTRGHVVLTDQPATAGGDNAAMTPVELLSPHSVHAPPSTPAGSWTATISTGTRCRSRRSSPWRPTVPPGCAESR